MNPAIKAKSRIERLCYAKEVREWLIDAGYEDRVDEIFSNAGPGFAQQSIEWLIQAIHDIRDCSYERSDIMDALFVILGNIRGGSHNFCRNRATRVLKTFGIEPPEADCDSAFFRILAGAKSAIYEEKSDSINQITA